MYIWQPCTINKQYGYPVDILDIGSTAKIKAEIDFVF